MRQILLSIFTFCILLMAGCRTTKSTETVKIDADERWAAQELLTATWRYDSLYRALVLSADSVAMEWSVPEDSAGHTAKTLLKAYKVNVGASHEASTSLVTDSTIKIVTKEKTMAEKIQSKQTASPSATRWLPLVIVASVCIVYSLRKMN